MSRMNYVEALKKHFPEEYRHRIKGDPCDICRTHKGSSGVNYCYSCGRSLRPKLKRIGLK